VASIAKTIELHISYSKLHLLTSNLINYHMQENIMLSNMGAADRIIRIIIALVIAALYFTKTITGTLAIVLGIIAVIFLLTSIIGFCPAYWPFKLSTRGKG